MGFKTVEERRTYFRNRYNGLRKAWFESNGPCKRCGSWERLQVDHVDPSLKEHTDNETRLWNWGKERREVELAKCQVLCVDCHRSKSAAERRQGLHNKFDAAGYRSTERS